MAYSHPLADDPLAEIAALRREVDELRRSLAAVRAPQVWADAQGTPRVRVGELPTGGYGVEVYDAKGRATWRTP